MSHSVLDQVKGRSPCVRCGRSSKFYCYKCCVLVSELQDKIQAVKLPLQIDIIRHPSECDGKSTATHAAVLSPDVTLYTYPCVPDYTKETAVLVFPSDAASTLQDYVMKMSDHSDDSKTRVETEPVQETRDNDIASNRTCDRISVHHNCTSGERLCRRGVINDLSDTQVEDINCKIEPLTPLQKSSNVFVADVSPDVSSHTSAAYRSAIVDIDNHGSSRSHFENDNHLNCDSTTDRKNASSRADNCHEHLSVAKRTLVEMPDSHCGNLSDVKKIRFDKNLSKVSNEKDNGGLPVIVSVNDTITATQVYRHETLSEQATKCTRLISEPEMNKDNDERNKASEPCMSIETAISDNVLVRDRDETNLSPDLLVTDGRTVETADVLRVDVCEDGSTSSTATIPTGLFKRVVFVDSRWTQTRNMVMDERLKDLPRIKLASYETRFWRHMEDTSRSNLATLEAVYYFLCEYHTHVLRKPYLGEYDGIMIFFNYMYSKLGNIQARVKGKK